MAPLPHWLDASLHPDLGLPERTPCDHTRLRGEARLTFYRLPPYLMLSIAIGSKGETDLVIIQTATPHEDLHDVWSGSMGSRYHTRVHYAFHGEGGIVAALAQIHEFWKNYKPPA